VTDGSNLRKHPWLAARVKRQSTSCTVTASCSQIQVSPGRREGGTWRCGGAGGCNGRRPGIPNQAPGGRDRGARLFARTSAAVTTNSPSTSQSSCGSPSPLANSSGRSDGESSQKRRRRYLFQSDNATVPSDGCTRFRATQVDNRRRYGAYTGLVALIIWRPVSNKASPKRAVRKVLSRLARPAPPPPD
jgi:hypothetical protein